MKRHVMSLIVAFAVSAGLVGAANPEVSVLDPRSDATTTSREAANILGRTNAGTSVTVGGVEVPVYSTGIFVRDQVPLQAGMNSIPVVVCAPDGARSETKVVINRVAPSVSSEIKPGKSLWIDAKSIQPADDLMVMRGDVVEVLFRGTPGRTAQYRWGRGGWNRMTEVLENDTTPTGIYRATMGFSMDEDVSSAPVKFRLRGKGKRSGFEVAESRGRVGAWGSQKVRLAKVKEDTAELPAGLHDVRLGGPFVTKLTSGTVLRITGQRGSNLRVQLLENFHAWISAREVEWLPENTPVPHLYFTSISASGDDLVDTVSIPYDQRVPYSITPTYTAGGNAALQVDFYGAHDAATWISHRPTAKQIREVSVEQVATDHLRVLAEMKTPILWGFRWDVTTSSLRIEVRRPPEIAASESPLRGLHVALEAGHGGPGNDGARGISGSKEKDINRMTVAALADELTSAGARVTLVRPGDEPVQMSDRVKRAIDANADMYISIHGNAGGTERGYLRVGGTSTYYKFSFNRDLSEAIHAQLLSDTQLADFGNVGNFNYYPLRTLTWMPAMLVEQAFMSNPADEAKMLDPQFRATLARSVREGMEDWLKQVRTTLDGK